MCVYSAYVNEAIKQWPGLDPSWPQKFPQFPYPGSAKPWNHGPGQTVPVTPGTDPKILQEILDIGRRLDRIDKALGLKDCKQEEASKRAFEDRLQKLIDQAKELQKSVRCDDDGCKPGSA